MKIILCLRKNQLELNANQEKAIGHSYLELPFLYLFLTKTIKIILHGLGLFFLYNSYHIYLRSILILLRCYLFQ